MSNEQTPSRLKLTPSLPREQSLTPPPNVSTAPSTAPAPVHTMLNAPKLSELLSKNADPQLWPRLFIMSPNGTLMAYSTPVDIKELRDQAALISMVWKEQDAAQKASTQPPTGEIAASADTSGSAKTNTSNPAPTALETLTIETQHNNILTRALQPALLLVLVGAVPPTRPAFFTITPETPSTPRYPPSNPPSPQDHQQPAQPSASSPEAPKPHSPTKPASLSSTMSQRERDIKLGPLHVQRKKLDALTAFIRAEFDQKGFVMPDDTNFP